MITVHLEPPQNKQVLYLVESAVQGEIARLELGLELAKKRVAPFEAKYGIASEKFVATWTAEDLQGGDDEYVQWAGEFKLMQRLEQKLKQLKDLRFDN
jgi:hypothetical protein